MLAEDTDSFFGGPENADISHSNSLSDVADILWHIVTLGQLKM